MQHEPSKYDLEENPMFEAIWQAIKQWDISREPRILLSCGEISEKEHRLYSSATGTDVKIILNAIKPFLKK